MFLIVKLALVTCGCYLGLAALLEAAYQAMNRWGGGGFGYALYRPMFMVVFGMIWLVSFTLAWRMVVTPLTSLRG